MGPNDSTSQYSAANSNSYLDDSSSYSGGANSNAGSYNFGSTNSHPIMDAIKGKIAGIISSSGSSSSNTNPDAYGGSSTATDPSQTFDDTQQAYNSTLDTQDDQDTMQGNGNTPLDDGTSFNVTLAGADALPLDNTDGSSPSNTTTLGAGADPEDDTSSTGTDPDSSDDDDSDDSDASSQYSGSSTPVSDNDTPGTTIVGDGDDYQDSFLASNSSSTIVPSVAGTNSASGEYEDEANELGDTPMNSIPSSGNTKSSKGPVSPHPPGQAPNLSGTPTLDQDTVDSTSSAGIAKASATKAAKLSGASIPNTDTGLGKKRRDALLAPVHARDFQALGSR